VVSKQSIEERVHRLVLDMLKATDMDEVGVFETRLFKLIKDVREDAERYTAKKLFGMLGKLNWNDNR
jgi:hypothetical protein